MAVKIEGMAVLQANIEKLAKQAVPKAVAKSINRVARNAIKHGTKTVSKEVKAPMKLIRKRARLTQKATTRQPVAKIRVNQHRVQRGFIQTLSNGRRQVMQRRGKARYSIDVVKIPLATPLTNAFHHELKDYSEQVKIELMKELSAIFRK